VLLPARLDLQGPGSAFSAKTRTLTLLMAEPPPAHDWSGGDPRALVALGNTYYELNRVSDARKAMQQAVRVAPSFADAFLGLGMVLVCGKENLPLVRELVPESMVVGRVVRRESDAQVILSESG